MKEELKQYINKYLNIKYSLGGITLPFTKKLKCIFIPDDEEDINTEPIPSTKEEQTTINIEKDVIPFLKEHGINIENNTLEEYIKETIEYNSFQNTIFKMIDERNLKDSDVYNKVHLDRRTFNKIKNESNYHPSKETVILLALSLELNENEMEELLQSASYILSYNNEYDLIIRFCFIKKIYTILEVNELLDEYNCKLFNY